jgi:hypothetical protein
MTMRLMMGFAKLTPRALGLFKTAVTELGLGYRGHGMAKKRSADLDLLTLMLWCRIDEQSTQPSHHACATLPSERHRLNFKN